VRSIAGQTVFIRRARGYVPDPIPLPVEMPPALGLGGELKATFCLTRGREAFVSQHLGDLDSAATLSAYRETLFHFCRLLDVRPTLSIAV
jgi:hydrogenase maturation protein HypF